MTPCLWMIGNAVFPPQAADVVAIARMIAAGFVRDRATDRIVEICGYSWPPESAEELFTLEIDGELYRRTAAELAPLPARDIMLIAK